MNNYLYDQIDSLAPKWKIGDIVVHPDGYKVKIESGRYWGSYGVSNHWTWRKVLKSGKLSKESYCGYGW